MGEIALREEVFKVVGAALSVHNHLGAGFLESVYAEALAIELRALGIPFEREVPLRIAYRGQVLEKRFTADFIVAGELILELKAIPAITAVERAQLLNYLRATGLMVGILFNFGTHPKMEWERLVHKAPE
ncbi:MAG: GxxExxY protein [Acidobacteria bacterium]|nr:GxxExxY protein [Acidobacteriota bacterium]